MEKLYNGSVSTIINILQLQCFKVTSPNTDLLLTTDHYMDIIHLECVHGIHLITDSEFYPGRPLHRTLGGPVGSGHPPLLHGDGLHALPRDHRGRAEEPHPRGELQHPLLRQPQLLGSAQEHSEEEADQQSFLRGHFQQ